MTHTDAQSSGSSALAQGPVAGEVVVIQIDTVGSVAHLQDAKATKRMRAIQPKKYMAIIDKISPAEPGRTWNICDVRVFSSPHWVTYEDENVDICYRVTVRLRALSTGTFKPATAHKPEHDSTSDDDDFEVTQQDLDAMQRPLSKEDWRRLEEAVEEVDETEDPDFDSRSCCTRPSSRPLESDRVIRELDLANRHAVLSLSSPPIPTPDPLGHASEASTEIVSDDDGRNWKGRLTSGLEMRARGEGRRLGLL
ncbi:hypothetical protein BC629DRAFT_1547965 [Irpex lacteus]|nr:hypothetical protein BC629DRAFT_1547965 [Irpex lacteus]